MTTTRVLFSAVVAVGLACPVRATQMVYDAVASSPSLYAEGSVFNSTSSTKTTLTQNYTQMSGTYDWGNDTTASDSEFGLAGSGASFATLNGDGTNHIQVRLNAECLASGTPPAGGGNPLGGASASFNSMFIDLDGLVPGQSYTLNYSWSVNATAGAPLFYNGGSNATGTMLATVTGGPPPITFFNNLDISSLAGDEPITITPSGSGSLSFTAVNGLNFLDLNLIASAGASFTGDVNNFIPPFPNDQDGATFYAEADFTLVPEPASLASLAMGAALLAAWGSRRRFART